MPQLLGRQRTASRWALARRDAAAVEIATSKRQPCASTHSPVAGMMHVRQHIAGDGAR
ncbi:hypothetical protein [Mesorhizobium sp. L2C084A000]|uniref:hypothetical protein n=1 Tax=unclassified Mesorhizobium TaxID=325217 RepID=UPI0003FC46C0|nr:hypothetical protein [Mesorhizobium sp. L2C084A000]